MKTITSLGAPPLTPEQINSFFEVLHQQNPSPQTELVYTSPFTLLLAVVLSAQATDKSVNKATKILFERIKTPQDVIDLGEEGLIEHIKTIGLYRTKAKNIMGLCHMLLHQFNGTIPHTREALESLPGVGRKTANVILSVAFGQPTIAVDTHLFRVANRTGLAAGKTPLEVELSLLQRIPQKWQHHAHHWLILLGRYICIARTPKCALCPVVDFCNYPQKNL